MAIEYKIYNCWVLSTILYTINYFYKNDPNPFYSINTRYQNISSNIGFIKDNNVSLLINSGCEVSSEHSFKIKNKETNNEINLSCNYTNNQYNCSSISGNYLQGNYYLLIDNHTMKNQLIQINNELLKEDIDFGYPSYLHFGDNTIKIKTKNKKK